MQSYNQVVGHKILEKTTKSNHFANRVRKKKTPFYCTVTALTFIFNFYNALDISNPKMKCFYKSEKTVQSNNSADQDKNTGAFVFIIAS